MEDEIVSRRSENRSIFVHLATLSEVTAIFQFQVVFIIQSVKKVQEWNVHALIMQPKLKGNIFFFGLDHERTTNAPKNK